MADHFTGTPAPVPPPALPAPLSDETRGLVLQLADGLSRLRPEAAMSDGIRLARALVLAEQLHGPTEAAYTAEQALLAALPPVQPGQTRGEYAAQLHLIAQGVTL
ncbi:hypothetical protein [Streptomyces showdoensis]|uniref:Uncharacterized protein n=1 Tax=Streptomyces showdoensis TaxID=68268 RepID=A0A2P2GLB1_STREW|nr:hypothetical protein [Streptomyces showdoensis]KKZ72297.1 hypothetical protein VO63_19145 [Streptomyces showdoensis]